MTIRGADQRCPRPPYPGPKFIFGLLLMDHSDHHRVKYFCEALDFEYHLSYPWGVPRPPLTLTPLDPYWGGMGGRSKRGVN